MGLGAAFWSGSGASALWYDLSTFTDGFNVGIDPVARELIVGPCKIYQEPTNVGGSQNRIQNNPGYDSGFFYAKSLTGGEDKHCFAVFLVGRTYPTGGANNAQYVLLDPWSQRGILVPKTESGTNTEEYDKNPMYKTGFIRPYDAGNQATQYVGQDVALSIHVENEVGTWRLHHYNPFAWSGTPSEVIASAAMHAGLAAEDIDQDAFDNAHDAYDLSTGDAPWTDLDYEWTIYAPRVIGGKVSDFLIQCADHSRDILFINELGKLSISSKTRPLFTATGFDLVSDQVLDILSFTMTLKHLFNAVRSGWGQAGRQAWDDTDGYASTRPGSTEQSANFEPTLESNPSNMWIHTEDNSSSITKFGQRWLKGKKTTTNLRGQPKEVELSHFPFLLTPHVDRVLTWVWDRFTDGGGMIHVTNWLNSDGKPRAEIEIRQGPMGFDLGLGDSLEDLEITGDGRTIADARIIKRTYDFDTLKIDSTVLEIPDNT